MDYISEESQHLERGINLGRGPTSGERAYTWEEGQHLVRGLKSGEKTYMLYLGMGPTSGERVYTCTVSGKGFITRLISWDGFYNNGRGHISWGRADMWREGWKERKLIIIKVTYNCRTRIWAGFKVICTWFVCKLHVYCAVFSINLDSNFICNKFEQAVKIVCSSN